MVVFECPIGAVADVKELEYVSALHQSSPLVRRDGSIDASDIKVFLRSRFGIEVSHREVCDTILQGMGGGNDDGQVLDLMEVVAILLIPVLRKAAVALTLTVSATTDTATPTASIGTDCDTNDSSMPPENLLHNVLQMILFDVMADERDNASGTFPTGITGDGYGYGSGSGSCPPLLTVQLLEKIFLAYGEEELASNHDILKSMVDHASHKIRNVDGNHDDESVTPTGENLVLDVNTFAAALTKDVLLFDIGKENSPSNAYMDVFGSEEDTETTVQESTQSKKDECLQQEEEGSHFVPPQADTTSSSPGVTHIYTASAIDSTAGTYRSKTLLVALWTGTLFTYLAFVRPTLPSPGDPDCGVYIIGTNWGQNAGIMACETTTSIFTWIQVFVFLCLFGMIFVGCGSIGNADNTKTVWAPLIGLAVITFSVVIPEETGDADNNNPSIEAGNNIEDDDDGDAAGVTYIKVISVILLCIVAVLHFLHLVFLCSADGSRTKEILGRHAMQDEIDLKIAQGYKLNNMVKNAMKIHGRHSGSRVLRTFFGHGIYEYAKSTERDIAKTGGFFWGWKLIWSKDVFRKEGIWFSVRMIASNISQYVVWLYILLMGIYLVGYIRENFHEEMARERMRNEVGKWLDESVKTEDVYAFSADLSGVIGGFLGSLNSSNAIDLNCSRSFASGWEAAGQICPEFLECNKNLTSESICALIDLQNGEVDGYTQMSLLDASGLDSEVLLDQVRRAMESAVDSTVDSLYPDEEYMITIPVVAGIIVALIVSAFLALGYLPSVTATYIQLRTGVIPTLTDDLLHRYRAAPDTVTLLTGSLFWGCLLSSILVGGIVALLVFFFIWQGSVYFAQRFVAIVIGVLLVTIIRVGVFCCGRSRFFRAFYRTKPAAANIFFLAMEWANFALSAGFVFVRMVKLMLVTSLSLGRIDSRFLAKGVGEVGPLELDAFPTIHLRDILSHEAHRHPYISILGTMYLMKLRYKNEFGTTAGSCWRLIFVYALMPWLQKYRIMDDATNARQMKPSKKDAEEEKFRASTFVKKFPRRSSSMDEKDEVILQMEKEIQDLRAALKKAHRSRKRATKDV